MSEASPPIFGRRRSEVSTNMPEIRLPEAAPVASTSRPLAQAAVAQPAAATTTRADIIELRALCLTRMDATAVASLQPERLLIEVERLISDLATERRVQLNGREQRDLAVELVDDMLGLGPLEALLADETINDIMVNGPEHTFVERSGKLVQVPVRFRDWAHLINICQRIAASVGRRVDEASPMCDARLKDGSRVNIILPPLAIDGPSLSIRKFSKKPIDFEKLIGYGSLTPPIARVLEIAARCRLNIIISGGTGSGKTTMMNALSRFIDPTERIVTVEDAAELQLQQPHIVRLETRPPNLEGKGEVNARDLVRNALRMRPDRIIIGEVRGAEAFDMLQAMNTGHDGSMSTIHANNTRDALSRIENMVQMSSMGLSPKAIRTQVVAAVNLIVQVERQRDGGRRLTQVTEIAGMEGETQLLNDIFKFEITGETAAGRLTGRYVVSKIRSTFSERLQYFGLERSWMNALEDVG
ncbi:MAG: pilus assembly protein CpaF [Acidocella sp. 20-63-7]|nr:MAG: pilus assembly protein CpaF [Acidocella sp. 20-63-7]HQT46279.1 CpaF family protein [Acidocella sp.]